MTEIVRCRGCRLAFVDAEKYGGLCADCDAIAYRRNREKWRITDD